MIPIDNYLDQLAASNSVYEKMQMITALRNSPEYSKSDKRKLYERLDQSSRFFADVCFKHIMQGKPIPLFHHEIYEALDDASLTYLGVIVFRQAAKSTLKVIKICQLVCTQKTKYSLLISETEDQALDDIRTIKDEFESNEIIKMLYFNGEKAEGEIWATGTIVIKNGVCLKAKGMNSRMRGLKYKFQRPDHVFLDDFESEDNSTTEEGRADVRDKISAAIIPLGDVVTRYCFFNTLPNDQCFMATELANPEGIFTPASNGRIVKYQITQMVNGEEVPTWPERYDWAWIHAKKRYYEARKEVHIWLQEYYNIPGNRVNPVLMMDMIKEHDCVFKEFMGLKYLEYRDGKKVPITVFTGVDPASTINKKSDNTVIFTLGATPAKEFIILEVAAAKVKITQQPITIMDTIRRFGSDNTTIETINAQLNVYDYLEKLMEDTDDYRPISKFNKTQSKNQKFLDGLEPVINGGKVGYVKDCKGIEILMNEGRAFSGGKREHDDTLDGFYLALLNVYYPGEMDVDEYIEFNSRERIEEQESHDYTYEWAVA